MSAPEGRFAVSRGVRRGMWLVNVVVLALFAAAVALERHALAALWQQLRVHLLALMVLPVLVAVWVQGKIFQRGCEAFERPIGDAESFTLSVLTNAGNYVGMLRLGAVAKAVYANRVRQLAYADYVVILGGNSVVLFLTGSLVGIGLMAGLGAWTAPGGASAVLGLVVLTGLWIAVLTVPTGWLARAVPGGWGGILGRQLVRLVAGWQRLRTDRSLLVAFFLWNVLLYGVAMLSFYIGFTVLLGRPLPIAVAAAFAVFTMYGNVLSLTPGNLGVQELVIAFLAHHFDYGSDAGLVVAGAIRAAHLVVVLVLLPWAWVHLQRQAARHATAAA